MHDAEIEAQVQRLTQILDEAAYRTRRSRRSLERDLGLAHGYLGNLFRGRTELKVYHVLLLAKLLHLDPLDLLRQALQADGGEPVVAAEEVPALPRENEVEGLEEKEEDDEEGRELALGLGLEQIRDLIRQTFRDEVRKLGGDLAKLATEEEEGGKG